MARVSHPSAHPAADAASVLRRLGFTILMLIVPGTALFARRAIVVLVPVGVVLLVLAVVLDGGARPVRESLRQATLSPGGLAAALVLGWCALSLVWTPFAVEASERLFNILGVVFAALAGYLSLPDRMRAANLYILPVGVALASFGALFIAFFARRSGGIDDMLTFERGIIVLVLLLWPAVGWLRSRSRHVEALFLAVLVALVTLLAPDLMPLQALVVGALVFALAAVSPSIGMWATASLMAGLLLLAPVLPFILKPLALDVLGAKDPLVRSLEVWRSVVIQEPARLVTGHGFETALRGRPSLLSWDAPNTLLFEIWYELGFVGAAAGAVALFSTARGAGRDHPLLVPAILAAFATAYTLACLGIGLAQIWWFTALAVVVLVFVAAQRGQFRTKRPKAILRRMR